MSERQEITRAERLRLRLLARLYVREQAREIAAFTVAARKIFDTEPSSVAVIAGPFPRSRDMRYGSLAAFERSNDPELPTD